MILSIKVLEVVVEGCIKCCQVMSRCYEWMRLDFKNSRVKRVRLSIKVLEVVVEGVYAVKSCRVTSSGHDSTLGIDESTE